MYRFVIVIIFFVSAFVAKGQTPTFTFKCVCDYLTAADTNCDICTSTLQSRFFKGLLIYKNGVAHKWIEQPYTIIQNFDALTFRELIPGAEQIRIELLGTAFDSIEQFRDSVMCPCTATSTGTTLIAGPGINIWNDTIASIPQQIDTFDLVSGTADTIRLSLTRDSVPFHFVILPPDSDNQYIDTLRLTGTMLEISLFGDNQPLKTVDLSSLVADGDETIVTAGTGISVSGIGTAGNPYVITNTGDLSATNEGILGVAAGGANDALLTSNTSGANGVTYSGGTGITISETTSTNGGTITITNAGDLSATNEIQTLSASGAGPTSYNIDLSLSGGSVTLSEGAGVNLTRTGNDITIASTITDTDDQGLTVEGAGPTYDIAIDNGTDVTIAGGGIVTLSESPANTLIITATEVDGSTSNELQTYGHAGTTSYTNTLSSGGGSFTLQSGGIVTLSHTAGTTTISATEVDGSISNELQILANTSDATSHTVTLSNSGGSVQAIEGSGIGLATGGTGLNGTVTITNTGDLSATNEAWTVDGDDADTEVISNQTVKFQGAGITTTDYSPATDVLLITSTEVDGSTSNELQTLSNTSDATTHTATLSNSGGSIQLAEGSNITLTTTGTGLNGIVTIAAAAAAATDLTFSGASSPVTLNSSTGTDVTITAGTGISLSATSGNITVTNTGDLSATNELQTLANTSTATTHVATLSNSGGSVTLSEGSGITIATTGTTLDGIATITAVDPSLSNEGSLTVAAGTGTTSVINSNTSGSTGVTIEAGTGLSISEAGNVITLTNTGDLSNTNEIQTYGHAGTTTYTNTLSLGGGSFSITGAGINVVSQTAGAVTITGTEVDGSIINEGILGVSAGSATSSVITSNTSGATGVTINAAGILTISESTSSNGGSITLTATEVDGSVTNELQTLANTSDATSHTTTLSNSGGSVKLVEGTGITIATTGTTLDGIATITATDASATNEIQTLSASGAGPTSYNIDLSLSGGSVTLSEGAGVNLTRTGNDITIASTTSDTDDQGLTIEGTGPTYDIAIDNGTDVTIAGGGIVTLSESPANTLIITATEVDGSVSNELQTYGHAGTISYTNTLSNGGGSFTLQSGGIVTLSHTAGTTTISAVEVDGSVSNELQILANTSDATSHTVTLSNSGGSVQAIEGSGIGLATGGTGLNGTVTITNTGDLSATNEAWTVDADDADTELITTQTVKFQGGGIIATDYIPGTDILTITGTEIDGSVTNEAWTIDGDDAETEVISNQTVKFQGAGITTTDYNPTTDVLLITSTEVDGSVSNELQTLANTSTATTHVATLSNSGGSVTLAEGSGITIATTGTTLDGIATIAATDASATNEIQALSASGVGPTSYNIDLSLSGGSVMLSEGAGVNLTRTGNDITIASTVTDTDDQGLTIDGTGPTYDIAIDNGTDVTIAGGGIVTLSESPANTLIVTATEVDGSTSNELQSYGHSGTTSYTNTLSSGGGSFTLQSGTNVTLSHTAGITTISAASGADGNGIYGDGTPGSGDDALPAGGSNVSIPNDNSPLDVIVDASPGNPNPFLAIRVLTDYCADDAITKYFIGKSPSDSLSIENFDCGAILNEVGGTLTLQTDKELYVVGDSINLSTVQTRTVMPYLAGLTTSGWLQKIEGTSTGQILVWDEPNGWWEIGAPPGGGTITGSGTSDRVAYWTGSSSIASDNDFTFDGTDVGIGTTTLTARLNVNENTASASPFIANFYSASTSNGSAFIGIANTNNTGTSNVRLGESALGTYGASITRYGSGHSSRAKELNIGTFEPSAPVTFTMNTIVRMTISTDANVYVANKIYAGAGTAVTGAHSTVHSAGSFAGAFLETVAAPTFDDTKHVVVYTGSTNVSWTLPTASTCTGRYYWLHHANSSGTITLSSSISKGNGGNFSTITAGQWAFIVSTGSGWRGFKISSL